MGAEPYFAAGFPAGHRNHQVALVGAPGGKAQLPGDALRHRHHLFGKTGGTVLPQQFLQCVHQKGLAGLFLRHFLFHVSQPLFVKKYPTPSYKK